MKTVLFLTSRLPLPADDGRSKTLDQYCNMLSKHCRIILVSLKGKKDKNKQANYFEAVEELEYPSFFKKLTNVLMLSFLRGYPLQVSGVYSKVSQKKINEIIKKYQPDIIICDMIRTARYIIKSKNNKAIKILDMDDLLSNRYKSSINTKEDPLGQFKDMLPKRVIKLIRFFHLNRAILSFEFHAMKKQELKSKKYFDKIILVSPKETKLLKEEAKTDKVITWPVCIEKSFNQDFDFYDPYCIGFLGNMDASQNQTTLMYICKEILPILPKKYTILVIGKCSQETKAKYYEYENVQFTGFVDSIDSYIKQCLCLLAPIQYGSGIKIKVLESMGLGIPVLTSIIGVEGLLVEHEKNVLICAEPKDYVKSIEWVCNSENRKKIIEEAFNYLKENHSYELCEKIMLNEILGEKSI